ncbi:MAG: GNAT family N-acetyltransferase [Acholeplasmataceae bacterium]|nr:GNAT family N-acetyltransferase [Acholeplasmataceae bacterium]
MNKVNLREVDVDNLREVCKLSNTLTPFQQKCVAPNAFSIAEAHFYPGIAWFRAIYLDDEPIGFVMISLKPEDIQPSDEPSAYLWRFMIAKDYQQKGYGSQVLDIIVDQCRKENYRYLYTSCSLEGDQPMSFYLKYGFVDTGVLEEDEEVLKLKL